MNNLRTNYCLRFVRIWGVLSGPPPPDPIPSVNVKVPFRGGEKYGTKYSFTFIWFLWKWKHMNKLQSNYTICICCVLPNGEILIFSESVYLYVHPMTGLLHYPFLDQSALASLGMTFSISFQHRLCYVFKISLTSISVRFQHNDSYVSNIPHASPYVRSQFRVSFFRFLRFQFV